MTRISEIFARIRRPSLRYGLIFGLILGVVQIAYGYASSYITQAGAQSILSLIGLALFLVFGFLAGQRAARETGKLGTGVIAGVWTGVIGSLVFDLVQIVGTLVSLSSIVAAQQLDVKNNPKAYPGIKPTDITPSSILTVFFLYLLFYLLFYTILTLIGGAIGGYMGRRNALVTADGGEYEEAMFIKPSAKDVEADDDGVEVDEAKK
jgi:hypothetical protein